jgi:hypothetical protein
MYSIQALHGPVLRKNLVCIHDASSSSRYSSCNPAKIDLFVIRTLPGMIYLRVSASPALLVEDREYLGPRSGAVDRGCSELTILRPSCVDASRLEE